MPHDWAVEQPFSPKGSYSHGFKAIGRNIPDASVGWYRKNFPIAKSDIGKRIHIAFDGVFRNSIVWLNEHYLGTEASGYSSFDYDITDYLNYGGNNVVAVRADVTMEEGWFYEGAGIYRHVWLNKTNPVHVANNGTFVTSQVNNNEGAITATVTVKNDGNLTKVIRVLAAIVDADGKVLAEASSKPITLNPFEEKDVSTIAKYKILSFGILKILTCIT